MLSTLVSGVHSGLGDPARRNIGQTDTEACWVHTGRPVEHFEPQNTHITVEHLHNGPRRDAARRSPVVKVFWARGNDVGS